MNWDEVAGNWEQFKGKVRQQWGKLTNDDLDVIKGKKEVLTGKLREKYGYITEKADEEINRFLSACSVNKSSANNQEQGCCASTDVDDQDVANR